jgi:hypothetical protein
VRCERGFRCDELGREAYGGLSQFDTPLCRDSRPTKAGNSVIFLVLDHKTELADSGMVDVSEGSLGTQEVHGESASSRADKARLISYLIRASSSMNGWE